MAKQLPKVTINGAGLVGSLLACLLAQKGYEVALYDKRPDPRKTTFSGGRSINLALSNRGWKALAMAGLDEAVRKKALPIKGRLMHSTEGELTFQPYGKEGQAIFSVSRGGLNQVLVEAAEQYPNVHIFFGHKCTQVDLPAKSICFEKEDGTHEVKPYEWLVGTDGAFSAIRHSLQFTDRFTYSQTYLASGYKELSIPPTATGDFALDPEALHIWPRGKFMLIALPNQDRSFTATLFLPFEGEKAFEHLTTEQKALRFFETEFADVVPLIPKLKEEFMQNPTSSLVTVRCNPWVHSQGVLLLGDAAHAIVPFYGQGMNSGFEDCSVWLDCLAKHQHHWEAATAEFQQHRIADADAISELAMRNFIEMRDKVADEEFLLQKKMEARIAQQFPGKWVPLYSRVTFSHQRYSEALTIGRQQDEIMKTVMQDAEVRRNWETYDFSQNEVLKAFLAGQ